MVAFGERPDWSWLRVTGRFIIGHRVLLALGRHPSTGLVRSFLVTVRDVAALFCGLSEWYERTGRILGETPGGNSPARDSLGKPVGRNRCKRLTLLHRSFARSFGTVADGLARLVLRVLRGHTDAGAPVSGVLVLSRSRTVVYWRGSHSSLCGAIGLLALRR